MSETLGAVVLCGGMSRRMGTPKAWLRFGDETLLRRIVRICGDVASPVVVVAAAEQDLPTLPGNVDVVRDDVPGEGPLRGIAMGLRHLRGAADFAYVTATDAPLLHPSFIRALCRARKQHRCVVPHVAHRYHPLASLWGVELSELATRLLEENLRRPFFVFERCDTLFADEALLCADEELARDDPTLESLRNLNTPDDYDAALRQFVARGASER